MGKIVLLSLVAILLITEASAYKKEDVDKFRATNKCAQCDLRGADLSNANLHKAELHEAGLSEATYPEPT